MEHIVSIIPREHEFQQDRLYCLEQNIETGESDPTILSQGLWRS